MWLIALAVFIRTLVGLFIVGIKYLGRSPCTFLFVSWSKNVRLKSAAKNLVWETEVIKKFLNCSYCPTGGLHKTLTKSKDV